MYDITTATAVTHQLYATLRTLFGTDDSVEPADRDRGAVSLEQVLWFVAAGVSVAVVAGILWATLRDEANNAPITPPAAP